MEERSKDKHSQEKESRDILDQLDRMRTDRSEILHGAQDISDFLEGFQASFNSNSMEEFPSPEQMDLLLQDIEFQREKSVLALTEISKAMEKIGHSSSTDLVVEDDNEQEGVLATNQLSEEHSKKISAATSRLVNIFSKSKKYYTDILHSFSTEEMDADVKPDMDANVETALIPMLQQRVVHLKKDLELARMKSQSLSVQWAADKAKFEDILAHNRQELLTLSQKLIVADSKRRYREQVERDENMVVESVSKVEYNHALAEIETLKSRLVNFDIESAEKKAVIDALTSENQVKTMDIANLDRKVVGLEQRLDLANQAKDHFQKKYEETVKDFEGKVVDLKDQIDKQRKENREAVEDLARQKDDISSLMDQISSLKKENDEYFRFLHKAEDDNRHLRNFSNDVQTKLTAALQEKDDIAAKLATKSTEIMSLQGEADVARNQLWKVINSVKMFGKTFKNLLTGNDMESRLQAQISRISELEGLVKKNRGVVALQTNKLGAMMRERNKEKMMRDYNLSARSNISDNIESVRTSPFSDTEDVMHRYPPVEESLEEIIDFVPGSTVEELQAQIEKFLQLDEKKSRRIESLEGQLVSSRKALDLQQKALESQRLAMDSQRRNSENKLQQQVSALEEKVKLLESNSPPPKLDLVSEGVGEDSVSLSSTASQGRGVGDVVGANPTEAPVTAAVSSVPVSSIPVSSIPVSSASNSTLSVTDHAANLAPDMKVVNAADSVSAGNPLSSIASGNLLGSVASGNPVGSVAVAVTGDTSIPIAPSDKGGPIVSIPELLDSSIQTSPKFNAIDINELERAIAPGIGLRVSQAMATSGLPDDDNSNLREKLHHFANLFLKTLLALPNCSSFDEWQSSIKAALDFSLFHLAADPSVVSPKPEPLEEFKSVDMSALDASTVSEDTLADPTPELNKPHSQQEFAVVQSMILKEGGLEDVDKLREADFHWLVHEGLADEHLMNLSRIEYKRRNQTFSSDDIVETHDSQSHVQLRRGSKHTQEVNAQLEAELERVIELNHIVKHMSFRQLSKYLCLTEKRMQLMGTFSAWRNIVAYKEGGIFLDILCAHDSTLRMCLAAKGGWKGAMEEVEFESNMTEETAEWPDFFRVKVLEYYRSLLLQKIEEIQPVSVQADMDPREASQKLAPSTFKLDSGLIPDFGNEDDGSGSEGGSNRSSKLEVLDSGNSLVDSKSKAKSSKSTDIKSKSAKKSGKGSSKYQDGTLDEGNSQGKLSDGSSPQSRQPKGSKSKKQANLNDESRNGNESEGESDLSGEGEEMEEHEEYSDQKSAAITPSQVIEKARIKKEKKLKQKKLAKSKSAKTSSKQKLDRSEPPAEEEDEFASESPSSASDFEEDDDAIVSSAILPRELKAAREKRLALKNRASVKVMARDTLNRQLLVRRSPELEVDSGDLDVIVAEDTRPLEVKQAEAKMLEEQLNTAMSAATQHLNSLLSSTQTEGAKLLGLGQTTLDEDTVPTFTKSLHKFADDLGFRLLSGVENSRVLIEIILEAIDCWKDSYSSQPGDLLDMSLKYCVHEDEFDFIRGLRSRLKSAVDFTGETTEVADKLQSFLAAVDSFAARTAQAIHAARATMKQSKKTMSPHAPNHRSKSSANLHASPFNQMNSPSTVSVVKSEVGSEGKISTERATSHVGIGSQVSATSSKGSQVSAASGPDSQTATFTKPHMESTPVSSDSAKKIPVPAVSVKVKMESHPQSDREVDLRDRKDAKGQSFEELSDEPVRPVMRSQKVVDTNTVPNQSSKESSVQSIEQSQTQFVKVDYKSKLEKIRSTRSVQAVLSPTSNDGSEQLDDQETVDVSVANVPVVNAESHLNSVAITSNSEDLVPALDSKSIEPFQECVPAKDPSPVEERNFPPRKLTVLNPNSPALNVPAAVPDHHRLSPLIGPGSPIDPPSMPAVNIPKPEDSLMTVLQQNRAKRQKDREEAMQIAANLRAEMANVIAAALASAVKEKADMGVQTDIPFVAEIDEESVQSEISENSIETRSSVVLSTTKQPGSTVVSSSRNMPFSTVVSPLPPGFQLVHIKDGELDLCPGVTLASYTKLTAQELAVLPRGVAYCYRDPDAAYVNGLKRVPRYVPGVPKIAECEAVHIPPVFHLTDDVYLITDISLEMFAELPPDIFVVQTMRNAVLPSGLTLVDLASLKQVPQSIQIPPGLELVQFNLAIMLPPGVLISPECEIVPPPPDFPQLPHNVQLIKRKPRSELPSFVQLLQATSKSESEIILHSKMEEGCTILKKPSGIDFGLGVELISRPAGHPMPVGMTPIHLWEYPNNILLTGLVELVRLTPRFDFPPECRFDDEWSFVPRPTGMRFPPNTYLVQYEGDRGGGILPNGMRRVPLPDTPYGVTIPKHTVAVEFLPGAGKPLPFGSQLCPGIKVLSPMEALVFPTGCENQLLIVDDLLRALPLNAVLVHRKTGVSIPQYVERSSKGNLPSGVLLGENVEILLLSVRFELPPGVKLESGAVLGRRTQLSPGTVLSRDLEVVEWPKDLFIPPGCELVSLAPGCDLPVGFHQVPFPRSELTAMGLGRECYVVSLPPVLKIESAQQLSEKITLLSTSEAAKQYDTKPKDRKSFLFHTDQDDDKDASMFDLLSACKLGAGHILAQRESKKFLFPSEISLLPKAALNAQLQHAISNHNVSVHALSSNSKPNQKYSSAASALQYLDVVQVAPTYRFPVGTEIAPGVVVQLRPYWIQHLPCWLELVTSIDDAESNFKDNLLPMPPEKAALGLRLLKRAQHMKTSVRSDFFLNPDQYKLPPRTDLVLIPDDIQVYSWGKRARGVEAVFRPDNICLPIAHFLVERPRGSNLPRGLHLGFSEENEKIAFKYHLPPGIEVVHIISDFVLPKGINLLSCAPISPCPVSAASEPIQSNHLSIPFQLSHGQQISPGTFVVSNPPDWVSPIVPSEADGDGINEGENVSKVFLFVYLDPDGFILPSGAQFVDNSDEFVRKLFRPLDVSTLSRVTAFKSTKSSKSRHIGADMDDSVGDTLSVSSGGTTSSLKKQLWEVLKLIILPSNVPFPGDRLSLASGAKSMKMKSDGSAQKQIIFPRIAAVSSLAVNVMQDVPMRDVDRNDRPMSANSPSSLPPIDENVADPKSFAWAQRVMTPPISTKQNSFKRLSSADITSSYDSPSRTRILLRGGINLGADSRNIPDVPTLLGCLDTAQEEIDLLEIENNKYRSKTVIAQREIDYLKNRVDRLQAQQHSKQEEFQLIRDQISDLKGQLANAHKTLELRNQDSTAMKKRLEERIRRLEAQANVLTTQLAHWQDVSHDVAALSKAHEAELIKLEKKFQNTMQKNLERVLRGCKQVIDLLVSSIERLASGAISGVRLQSLQAIKIPKPLLERFGILLSQGYSESIDAISLKKSPLISAPDEVVMTDDVSVLSADEGSLASRGPRMSESVDSSSSKYSRNRTEKHNTPKFLPQQPLRVDSYPDDYVSIVSKPKMHVGSEHLVRNGTISSLFPKTNYEKFDIPIQPSGSKFLGVVYLQDELSSIRGDIEKDVSRGVSGTKLDSIVAHFDNLFSPAKVDKLSTELLKLARDSQVDSDEISMDSGSLNDLEEMDNPQESSKLDAKGTEDAVEEVEVSKETEEILNGIQKLVVEITPMLLSWVDSMVFEIKEIEKKERVAYLHALQMADIEIQVYFRKQKLLEKKCDVLECKLADLRQVGDGAPLPTFQLRDQIIALRTEIERVQSNRMLPVIESLKKQAEDVRKMEEMEISLLSQSQYLKKQSEDEEERMLEESRKVYESVTEVKELKENAGLLMKQSEQFVSRAEAVRRDREDTIESILRDLEAYQQAVQGTVPSDLLAKLLHWGNMIDRDSKKKKFVGNLLQDLSPNRSRVVDLDDETGSVVSAVSMGSTSMQSHLDTAAVTLTAGNRLRFGSVGTMPPAPSKSVFNVNNYREIDDNGKGLKSNKSDSKGNTSKSTSKVRRMRDLVGEESSVHRGGIVSGTRSLTLPAIGKSNDMYG